RTHWLLTNYEAGLSAALGAASEQGLAPTWVSPANLAWALAFNLALLPEERGNSRPAPKKILGCPARRVSRAFQADTPFAVAWQEITRWRAREQTTGLVELAWSVACEQRADWQHPECPKPVDTAEKAFAAVLARCYQPITKLLKHLYQSVLPPDEV